MTDLQTTSQFPSPTSAITTIPDFSIRKPPRQFRIDSDTFHVPAVLPAAVAVEFSRMTKMNPNEQFLAIGEVLDIVMLPESAELFARRMRDPSNPIGVEHIAEVVQWLMQEYGDRPTQPSSDSQASPMTTGTPSTAGAPLVESTP